LDRPSTVRARDRLIPVLVPLAADSFELDVDAVSAAMTNRTCAILLSHPANPTGRCYTAETLARLAAAIERAERELGVEITVIADETHRDFVGTGGYESAASHHARTLIVYSFGKYHFLQGQRIGYVATSPRHPARRALATELVRWTRVLGFVTPTALMQRALPELLSLRHDLTWLDAWRKRYVDELTDAGYDVVRPDATLFMYVRTPEGDDDFEFVERLARAGVLVLPAPVFHDDGHFRLSLTGSEDMLERALPILGEAAR
jgi:aspartate aminotransferase